MLASYTTIYNVVQMHAKISLMLMLQKKINLGGKRFVFNIQIYSLPFFLSSYFQHSLAPIYTDLAAQFTQLANKRAVTPYGCNPDVAAETAKGSFLLLKSYAVSRCPAVSFVVSMTTWPDPFPSLNTSKPRLSVIKSCRTSRHFLRKSYARNNHCSVNIWAQQHQHCQSIDSNNKKFLF